MNNCIQPSCPCDNHIGEDIEESVEQYHSWNKYGVTNNINIATVLVIGFLLAGIVVAMIFANIPASVN